MSRFIEPFEVNVFLRVDKINEESRRKREKGVQDASRAVRRFGHRRFVGKKHLSHSAASVFMLTVYFREW